MRPRPANSLNKKAAAAAFAAIAAICLLSLAAVGDTKADAKSPNSFDSTNDTATAALCPVVYPDDQTPQARGYHYTFFGNAFFINDEGYLLTVAHVVATFGNGGQAYVLVNRPDAPPRLVKITVVATDKQHDVAILRATPNPFAGGYKVAYVALSNEAAAKGQSVLALSLHPQRAQDAHSFESQREDSSPGTVLSYESTKLEKFGPPSDVFLLSHPVVKGQSGSPVLATESHAVVGLVEGLWLRGTPLALAKSATLPTTAPGAAIPIRYAQSLLKENDVTWHFAVGASHPEPN